MKSGDIVVVGLPFIQVTEDVCGGLIESKTKYKLNKDFLGYSPERINLGTRKLNIDKIISASNKDTLNKLDYLYSKIIKAKIIKVKNIKIAEAAKVIENTQRDISIALVNELSMLFNKLNLNTNEVL